ncbi:hypothetical protein EJ06DRAFT_231361 [Trichodelitschia bisporula]|uniref:Uncharacterized protein n=1 Tax=Trichodelitschia bisporula TaxID=703511 RepID=A0A6G1HLE5_9PEZI|nr:hypothetical protein EJ06DRAFT_231361 [Trichodelitschia bisporula]
MTCATSRGAKLAYITMAGAEGELRSGSTSSSQKLSAKAQRKGSAQKLSAKAHRESHDHPGSMASAKLWREGDMPFSGGPWSGLVQRDIKGLPHGALSANKEL